MKAKILSGIYYIRNKVNGKMYIGLSVNIGDRIRVHMKDLGKNFHPNTHLQKSWNKYGKDNFEFGILEECLEKEMETREIYWIETYDSFASGYNRTQGGYGVYFHNEEIRNKKRLDREGKKYPEAFIMKELRRWSKAMNTYCLSRLGITYEDLKIKENKSKKEMKELEKVEWYWNKLQEMRV